MVVEKDDILEIINKVDELTKDPEKYIGVQEEEAEEVKKLTKKLYDFSKKNEAHGNKASEALQELIIEDFDEEQIWQQIELQNVSLHDFLVKNIPYLIADKRLLKFPLKKEKKKSLENGHCNKHNGDEGNEVEEEAEAAEEKNKQVEYSDGDDEEEEEEEGDDDDEDEEKSLPKTNKRKAVKSSEVDDKFFKLHEMEEFLEKVEKEEDGVNDDSDDDIDYFEDEGSDEEKEMFHYKDFFDEPENDVIATKRKKRKRIDEEEEEEEEEDEDGDDDFDDYKQGLGNKKKVKFAMDDEKDNSVNLENEEDEEEESEEDGEENENDSYPPSSFEARQQRLKQKIAALEEEALKEKPWQMKGEVTGSTRPQNSLLEEYVEFDVATRPAPILTEKSTMKLEDVIIQRIKDKAWDDVVRKIKPVEGDLEYKKKLVLDQEKSKLSLAQIYEQEYIKQLDSKNEDLSEKPEVEPPEHQEIRVMMSKLFSKLEALSNFHFTPKQAEPEIKIITNVPAISMEEVAPVATSDAALLAPEEIKKKQKGDLIGKNERSSTDKKRERRKKKLKQKLKFKKIEAKAKAQLESEDSKNVKGKNLPEKVLQKITKSRNVTHAKSNSDGKYIKSSNAFFSKLQDNTSSVVKKKAGFEAKSPIVGKKLKSKKIKGR